MSRYLKRIVARRYGAQVDREIGPLGEGLNVVFGENEAGKTTFSALIGGVLFGWEDAHGVRNTYRPENGGRLGELVWAESGHSEELRLVRTESELIGDTSITHDIDRETFNALFSLTADELRSLRSSPDVTARLLTASSGAATDPASAFVEVERRIASTPIYRLSSDLEEKRDQVKAATEQARLYVQEDRELRELKENRTSITSRIAGLEEEREDLVSARAELAAADQRAGQLVEERDRACDELAQLASSGAEEGESVNRRLLLLDSAGEHALRNRLDELSEEQEKLSRAVDAAKENSASSTAAYEALCELDDEEVAASRRVRNRPWQATVSVLMPVAFIAAGIPLFVHGREINSLSITALGVSLVVVAIFLAAAAFIGLFRQPQGAVALDGRRKDAQWVMLQDKKKLDACLADKATFEQEVDAFFEEAGLARAEGSIRQARSLLDEASSCRTRNVESEQRKSALRVRVREVEKELSDIEETRKRIADKVGLALQHSEEGLRRAEAADRPSSTSLDLLIREKNRQRDALLEAASGMSERIGELTSELELARSDQTLGQLRLEYQQIRTRLRESKHELIALLLAKRILERSMATWEERGQPEVFARAGRLMSVITAGRWVGVSTSATGSLVAVSADGNERDPRHLSLGTCQQLYLALRIALLTTAENVGRDIPVLADDILVNFDATRREGAARALAELARRRQVIVFTCHEETVAALRAASPGLTCERL